jgi:hypothetical protein
MGTVRVHAPKRYFGRGQSEHRNLPAKYQDSKDTASNRRILSIMSWLVLADSQSWFCEMARMPLIQVVKSKASSFFDNNFDFRLIQTITPDIVRLEAG